MADANRTYPYAAFTLGRLVVTSCRQADSCPVIDGCHTWSADGWQAAGVAIRLSSGPGRALVLAIRGRARCGPWPRLIRVPLLGRLFRMRRYNRA